jgi:lipocalin
VRPGDADRPFPQFDHGISLKTSTSGGAGSLNVRGADLLARYHLAGLIVGHGDLDCTEDCAGHEAGYKWAEEHEISDEDDCTGNSGSFIEGCKAYVVDNG